MQRNIPGYYKVANMYKINRRLLLLMGVLTLVVLFCTAPAMAARSTVLSFQASPDTITAGGYVELTGVLKDSSGSRLTGKAVLIEVSKDAHTWSTAAIAVTRLGNFSAVKTLTDPGYYYFRASYSGNMIYGPSTSPPVLVIITPPTGPGASTLSLNVSPASVDLGGSLTFTGTLANASSMAGLGNQPIFLDYSPDGVSYSTLALVNSGMDGNYTYTQAQYTPGSFWYKARFEGSTWYTGSESEVRQATVNGTPEAYATTLTITADPTSVKSGIPVKISGKLSVTDTGMPVNNQPILLQMSSNGVNWGPAGMLFTLPDGNYTIFETLINPGTYYFRAQYQGSDDLYLPSQSGTVMVTVSAKTAKSTMLTVNATPATINLGKQVTISGNLTDTFTGKGLSGLAVTVYYSTDGVSWKTAGLAAARLGAYQVRHSPPNAGTYYYKAAFSGSAAYSPSESGIVMVEVNGPPPPKATDLSITADTTNPEIGQTIAFQVRLAEPDTGDGIGGRSIRLRQSRDGVNYNSGWVFTTYPNGNYTFLISLSDGGTYYYRASFDGDSSYLSSQSQTLQIVVKKVSALTMDISPVVQEQYQDYMVSGRLTDARTWSGIGGATIELEQSVDTENWTVMGFATTMQDGSYRFEGTAEDTGTFYYRTEFPGSIPYTESISNSIGVIVNPALVD
jgi:3D (Asp-Asp-Asp) domain-containing protein